MNKIIGVTGSIATGKSTVLKVISEKYEVIDADVISHNLTLKNQKGYDLILKTFGKSYFKNDALDRQKLGNLIFNDSEKRRLLDSLIHPLIYEEIANQLKNKKGIIFIDIPLLFETNYQGCDEIICVYTNYETQIKRLSQRNNISFDEAKIKIATQMDVFKKAQLSDYVIDNSFDLENTFKQLNLILRKIEEKK